uniref:Uncharacterized protein n=1 Tax=Glossina pallidipes TaxID=7398 RepID=A0A1B0AGY4_GLOPL
MIAYGRSEDRLFGCGYSNSSTTKSEEHQSVDLLLSYSPLIFYRQDTNGKLEENLKLGDEICPDVKAEQGTQYGLKTRLEEITYAIGCGARETDIVINRQQWQGIYEEVC